MTNLVAWAKPVHCTYLVGWQSFAEQVDGRHLATEHSLLVQLWRRSDIALVERLQHSLSDVQLVTFYTLTYRLREGLVGSPNFTCKLTEAIDLSLYLHLALTDWAKWLIKSMYTYWAFIYITRLELYVFTNQIQSWSLTFNC